MSFPLDIYSFVAAYILQEVPSTKEKIISVFKIQFPTLNGSGQFGQFNSTAHCRLKKKKKRRKDLRNRWGWFLLWFQTVWTSPLLLNITTQATLMCNMIIFMGFFGKTVQAHDLKIILMHSQSLWNGEGVPLFCSCSCVNATFCGCYVFARQWQSVCVCVCVCVCVRGGVILIFL